MSFLPACSCLGNDFPAIRYGRKGFFMETRFRARATRGGLLLIAVSAVLWGTVGVTTRTIYELSATNPLSIGFFRLAFAAPALLVAAVTTLGRGAWRIAPRDAGLAALIGGLLGLYQVCYFTAIGYAGVAIATLVTLCTAPVIAALLAAAVARERLTRSTALALCAALAGTALLVGVPANDGSGQATLIGALFALGSAFGYAAVTVCGRVVAERAHTLQVNSIALTTGALLLLALALPTAHRVRRELSERGVGAAALPRARADGAGVRAVPTRHANNGGRRRHNRDADRAAGGDTACSADLRRAPRPAGDRRRSAIAGRAGGAVSRRGNRGSSGARRGVTPPHGYAGPQYRYFSAWRTASSASRCAG
jgi:drug/metabolite transporter (DMT)-like permease